MDNTIPEDDGPIATVTVLNDFRKTREGETPLTAVQTMTLSRYNRHARRLHDMGEDRVLTAEEIDTLCLNPHTGYRPRTQGC